MAQVESMASDPGHGTMGASTDRLSTHPDQISRAPGTDSAQAIPRATTQAPQDADAGQASATMSSSGQPEEKEKPKAAFTKFRTEYQDLYGDVLFSQNTEAFKTETAARYDEEPVFEVVTILRARARRTKREVDMDDLILNILSKPTYRMEIYSPAIINALRSVVQYYPSQSLEADPVVVPWPYCVLVHHYDELIAFRDATKAKDEAELCDMEKNAPEHLTLLIDFLDEHIMPDVRLELERIARGACSWEWVWVRYKPGTTLVEQMRGDKECSTQVIQSVDGGVFSDPPMSWTVRCWSMVYDGKFLGRTTQLMLIDKFDGESTKEVYTLKMDDLASDKVDALPEMAKRKIKYGKTYLDLLDKQCKHLDGEGLNFPYTKYDGLVMVDIKDYYEEHNAAPETVDEKDCRPYKADGSCDFCKQSRRSTMVSQEAKSVEALFANYTDLALENPIVRSSAHIALLCPHAVDAFVFKTRTWESVHVGDLSEPKFEERMIEDLVMDAARKDFLKALAKSYARTDKDGAAMTSSLWTADFVKDKGSGLIFLLHGRPGVGKTCTAECIAAFTKRPLMILTSSDIGETPGQVELNLTRMFKRARSWNAVLLIDEADVYMERRAATDLVRNSLVAGFLRALENYDGILFLTTNRVGSFDDAFVSRVHVQLYYPEFDSKKRQAVWQTFMSKLARDRGKHLRLNIDAKEYISSEAMKAMEWNGREIRNALQIAVALAEFDAEKDEDGKILVTDKHMKAIVELSKDFKDYLNDLHKGNESTRAEKRYERLDRRTSGA